MLSKAVRGAIAGTAATWLMDQVTTGLLEQQPEEVTRREEAARPNGKSSVGNLVDRLERQLDLQLNERQRGLLSELIHYGLGAVPGAAYALVRHRVPLIGAGRGLVYGILLLAINDEYVNTALGFAGPFEAYPLETHWRGFVGHAVLGVATDVGIDVLGG